MQLKLVALCVLLLAPNYVLSGCLEPNPTVQASPTGDLEEFRVAVELVMFQSQIDKYPKTADAFKRACATWESVVPVKIQIHIEDPTVSGHMAPWFTESHAHDQPDIVCVLLDDLQGPPYLMSIGILGYCDIENDRILLDGDFVETHTDIAYSVCLHEIGHLLGLPHIVGKDSGVLTGFVVLPVDDTVAQEGVMYPVKAVKYKQETLSKIEIELARWHVLHVMTDPASKTQTCKLTIRYK